MVSCVDELSETGKMEFKLTCDELSAVASCVNGKRETAGGTKVASSWCDEPGAVVTSVGRERETAGRT